jgi:hypothetical protein
MGHLALALARDSKALGYPAPSEVDRAHCHPTRSVSTSKLATAQELLQTRRMRIGFRIRRIWRHDAYKICDLSHPHTTILCTRARNTPTIRFASSSERPPTLLPATSSNLRTSSGLTTPNQSPISRVKIDFRMFSRACCTVRKYEPTVTGLD